MAFDKVHVPAAFERLPRKTKFRETAGQEKLRLAVNKELESAAMAIERMGRDNPGMRHVCSACAQTVRDRIRGHPRLDAPRNSAT